MADGIILLCGTAASIGLLHTMLGPDHYLPFVAMSRVGGWSLTRTAVITILCGVGHVLSSVVLGLIGITFGVAVLELENVEALRGDIAGWLMLAFGLAYLAWGVRRAIRNKPHHHRHFHADGTLHAHRHTHTGEHTHVHDASAAGTDASASEDSKPATMTPWILFTIFLFGPCEPPIPLLMYPAAKGSLSGVVLVVTVFGLTTIATMTTIVIAACLSAASFRLVPCQPSIVGCATALRAVRNSQEQRQKPLLTEQWHPAAM